MLLVSAVIFSDQDIHQTLSDIRTVLRVGVDRNS